MVGGIGFLLKVPGVEGGGQEGAERPGGVCSESGIWGVGGG